MGKKHDKLQSDCYLWFHNAFPEYRDLLFSTLNNLTDYESSKQAQIAKMMKLKALGLSAGVTDLLMYFNGVLYALDIKVGNDRLSDKQQKFIASIEKQGGSGMEIRSLEQFKKVIYDIIGKVP